MAPYTYRLIVALSALVSGCGVVGIDQSNNERYAQQVGKIIPTSRPLVVCRMKDGQYRFTPYQLYGAKSSLGDLGSCRWPLSTGTPIKLVAVKWKLGTDFSYAIGELTVSELGIIQVEKIWEPGLLPGRPELDVLW